MHIVCKYNVYCVLLCIFCFSLVITVQRPLNINTLQKCIFVLYLHCKYQDFNEEMSVIIYNMWISLNVFIALHVLFFRQWEQSRWVTVVNINNKQLSIRKIWKKFLVVAFGSSIFIRIHIKLFTYITDNYFSHMQINLFYYT